MFKSQLDISKNACRSLFPPKRTFKIKLDSKIDGVLMLQVKKSVVEKFNYAEIELDFTKHRFSKNII